MSQPYYWNRDNFEGLASLSSALRADSRLERLAAYCELREKGLRRQAFAQLDAFLSEAASWDVPVQRALAVHVLDAHWKTPDVHQFLTDPLRKRFLERVLEEWRVAEANSPVPVKHLALLRGDGPLLAEALRMNPKDDFVRAALAGILLRDVDYATHHLDEGSFIGDEDEASALLAHAGSVLAGMEDPSPVQPLNQQLERLTALLSDWREYQRAPEGTFRDWCRSRNRNHSFSSHVYYAE